MLEPEQLVNPFRRRTTGRFLVAVDESATAQDRELLVNAVGGQVIRASDFGNAGVDAELLAEADAIVLDRLGVAVVNALPEEIHVLGEDSEQPLITEPERVVYAEATVAQREVYQAQEEATWGLEAVQAMASRYTGRGVRVAILDTGLDLGHPDFARRNITRKSFVAGEEVQDGNGHGTHCVGIACGPRRPRQGPGYGVAPEAEIFVGKVLNNRGRGVDGNILAGIEWAVENRCQIVSMSLGASQCDNPDAQFSRVFEIAARRALAAGTVIIAAAGNDSARPSSICPVHHPANCPTILAVGAIDSRSNVAPFSCGGLNPRGGQVNIAAPGVGIHSSWPRPDLYRTKSGTSMATPFVAGIAALLCEAYPDLVGPPLSWLLLEGAKRLPLPRRDVGIGLVQAP